jgi:4-hydroxybenzoyl-CoA thioesterase
VTRATVSITVRFGDCDPAGLVYYPVLFHYCHVAMEEFFAAACGVSYPRLMAESRIGFPTVSVRTEFRAPFVYGDEVEVEVFVSRVGRSSATFEYRLRRPGEPEPRASATLVQVAMNLDTRRPVEIPPDLRRAFGSGSQ